MLSSTTMRTSNVLLAFGLLAATTAASLAGPASLHAPAPPALAEDALVAAVLALYADDGAGTGADDRGTALLLEVHRRWKGLSPRTRDALLPYVAPPVRVHILAPMAASSEGSLETTHFAITYKTAGKDKVPADDTDGNGIPDYVDQAAAALERAWAEETGRLGYAPPTSTRVQVTFKKLKECGLTHPEDDRAAWVELSTRLADDDESRAKRLLDATCAHELFHVVQFGYSSDQPTWWMEGTAQWMEKQVLPESHSYLDFTDVRLASPQRTLFAEGDDSIEYGGVLAALYIDEAHGGPDAIRRLWDACRKEQVAAAIVAQIGSLTDLELALTAYEYLGQFRDQKELPEMAVAGQATLPATFAPDEAHRPEYLGANVVEIRAGDAPAGDAAASGPASASPAGNADTLAIRVVPEAGALAAVRVLAIDRAGGAITLAPKADSTNASMLDIPGFTARYAKAAVIVVGATPDRKLAYTLSATLR